jgi:hypothetical protein
MKKLIISLLLFLCVCSFAQKSKTKIKTIQPIKIDSVYNKIDGVFTYTVNRGFYIFNKECTFIVTPLLNKHEKSMTILGFAINSYKVNKCINGLQLTFLFDNDERASMYTFKDFNCKGEANAKMDTTTSYFKYLTKFKIQAVRVEDFDMNYIYDVDIITKENKSYFVDLFSKINEYNNKRL